MKPTFYTKLPSIYTTILLLLYILVCILTVGGGMRYYDFFLEHKYWLNRRVLLKYLEIKDLSFSKELILKNIIEYKFQDFHIWYHSKQLKLTLSSETDEDLIGLFTVSSTEDRMVIKLIRKLTKLTTMNIFIPSNSIYY